MGEGSGLLSLEELQAIFEGISDLYFRVNQSGICLDIHSKNATDLPVSVESIPGRPLQEVMPPAVADSLKTALTKVAP